MPDSRQIIIIILKPQMTEKSHLGLRPRYVEFRFEDSLRRYQQPPRKLVKLNDSVCRNCCRKSCQSVQQNRLIRFCQTRRYYHATSRQKASEFSRKKQAKQQSSDKQSGHVSDFNCHENGDGTEKKQKQNQYEIEYQITLENECIAKKLFKMQKPINWSVSIQQTPIKQSIREQLKHICSSQKSGQKQQTDMNQFKVKDIDFHIGLVEQLHQKINQYMKFQTQPNEPSNIQEEIRVTTNYDGQIEQFRMDQKVDERYESQSEMNDQKQQANYETEKRQCQNQQQMMVEQVNNQRQNSMQDNIMETGFEKAPSLAKTQQISQNISDFLSNKQKQVRGRVEIKGEKGSCYLSIRILNKLLNSDLSPNRVTSTVMRHHPYLGQSHIMQIIADKQLGDE